MEIRQGEKIILSAGEVDRRHFTEIRYPATGIFCGYLLG